MKHSPCATTPLNCSLGALTFLLLTTISASAFSNLVAQATLRSSNGQAGDAFGKSVGISGDTVVSGAYLEDSNATGVDGDGSNNSSLFSGAAYVHVRNGGTWGQEAYLKASNTGTIDNFGRTARADAYQVLRMRLR